MKDNLDIYRAHLDARALSERLLAAFYDADNCRYHLSQARKDLESAEEKLDTAILSHIAPASILAEAFSQPVTADASDFDDGNITA
jgi:hypothetical protein